jgi:hypothetical protein
MARAERVDGHETGAQSDGQPDPVALAVAAEDRDDAIAALRRALPDFIETVLRAERWIGRAGKEER